MKRGSRSESGVKERDAMGMREEKGRNGGRKEKKRMSECKVDSREGHHSLGLIIQTKPFVYTRITKFSLSLSFFLSLVTQKHRCKKSISVLKAIE